MYLSDALFSIKVVVAFLFLIYTCKLDLRERRVPNKVWKYMLLVFIPLDVVEFLLLKYSFTTFIFAIVQFLLMVGFAYMLYYIGAYGGADAKALMVLAIAFPIYPKILIFPVLNNGFGVFSFSVLSNSVISAPLLLIYMFFRNLTKEGLKNIKRDLFYYFVGVKVDAKSIPKFYNLLEYFDGDEFKRVKRGVEPDLKMISRLKREAEKGTIDRIWATPALPFLIFITIGFLISVFVGDLLVWILSLFIGKGLMF
ncbi:peptidase A24 [Archaeoglobales archaeon]|nr:MAG: peptidase A24 [Archaeoglobales archaeon]